MNDLECDTHHYYGALIQEICPICKLEREQRLQLLLNAVEAGKEMQQAQGAMFRTIQANRFGLPPHFMEDYIAELEAAGVKDGFGARFDDAVKALEAK